MAGKMRSPNYPALTLPQAVEVAGKLWTAEKRTAVSNETAAVSMGYKSLSGPVRVAIGAMRQYGLIEKTEKGYIRLSDLAVNILHGEPAERFKAMTEAALNPTLFHELAGSHLEASEPAIRSYLITKKGFAEDGARKAARAFRETLALVNQSGSGYTGAETQQQPEATTGMETGQTTTLGNRTAEGSGVLSLKVPYGTGALAVEIRVTGERLKRSHIERVRKYLELAEGDLSDNE